MGQLERVIPRLARMTGSRPSSVLSGFPYHPRAFGMVLVYPVAPSAGSTSRLAFCSTCSP